MPVIRTHRRVDTYIEDFEECYPPELYPMFLSVDYMSEPSGVMEENTQKTQYNKKKKLFQFLVLKGWFSFMKT